MVFWERVAELDAQVQRLRWYRLAREVEIDGIPLVLMIWDKKLK
jgi:hypothetical protein